jgi:hypothetical protein
MKGRIEISISEDGRYIITSFLPVKSAQEIVKQAREQGIETITVNVGKGIERQYIAKGLNEAMGIIQEQLVSL